VDPLVLPTPLPLHPPFLLLSLLPLPLHPHPNLPLLLPLLPLLPLLLRPVYPV
jgi:hypothetical protein